MTAAAEQTQRDWTPRGGPHTSRTGVDLPGTYWAIGDAPVQVRQSLDLVPGPSGQVEMITTDALHVINCGGGRQSTDLVLRACAGEIERPDLVLMADTGDERPATIAYWWRVLVPAMDAAGIPWRLVARMHTHTTQAGRRGSIAEDTLRSVAEGYRIAQAPLWLLKDGHEASEQTPPGVPANRACTSEAKIDPMTKCLRHLLGLRPGQKWASKGRRRHAVQAIGIAAEEASRITDQAPIGSGAELVYPLVEEGRTTAECVETIERLTDEPAPCKSACIGCPYRTPESWALMKRDEPDAFAQAVAYDEKLRHPFGLGRLNDGLSLADYLAGKAPEPSPSGRLKGLNAPAYLLKSCVPLAQATLPDPDTLDEYAESFGGEC